MAGCASFINLDHVQSTCSTPVTLAEKESAMTIDATPPPLLPGEKHLTVYDLWLWLDAVLRRYGPDVQLAAHWPVTQGPTSAWPIIDARVWRTPTGSTAVLCLRPGAAQRLEGHP
jgi:hypothetical protein